MSAHALVIDGGKSKTAVATVDADGRVVRTAVGPGLAIIGEPGGAEALGRSLRGALDALGAVGGDFHTAVFGLNGVHAPSPDAGLAADVLRPLVTASRIVVTSDGVLSYLGALGTRPGVAVTAGTGAVLLAVDAGGRAHRVDGDGPLLGDRGSGYAIGLAGLRAAMSVLDGLEGTAGLAEELQREYGTPDEAARIIHGSTTATRLIASFSRNVADAANRGDHDARVIWHDAGVVLARGAAAAAHRAGLSDTSHAVTWSGGLFGVGELLHRPFAEELARIAPRAGLQPAAGGAIAGGAVLAGAREPVMDRVASWFDGAGR